MIQVSKRYKKYIPKASFRDEGPFFGWCGKNYPEFVRSVLAEYLEDTLPKRPFKKFKK